MSWHVFETSIHLIRCLRPLVERIALGDSALANQIRRAASSVPLNLSEGRRRAGRDRIHHWRIAAGSAEEVQAALRTAEAWGHIDNQALPEALALLDRILAMTWKMTHAG